MNGPDLRPWTRRAVMQALGVAALPGAALAQSANPGASVVGDIAPHAGPMDLPLRATILEHIGTVVPDVAASTRFHSRLFNPNIRKENAGALRAYVDLSGPDGEWGYLAFGDRGEEAAYFDHFCATIADYNPEAMAETLRAQGIDPGANWATFGQFFDPDDIGVQVIADPGGWFPTVIDAEPMVEGPAVLTPKGLAHVTLRTGDIDRSVEFYRKWFGPEAGSNETGQVWFRLGSGTVTLMPPRADGPGPGIDHICVRTAPFDRDAVIETLTAMGATASAVEAPSGATVRFTDPAGLIFELQPEGA